MRKTSAHRIPRAALSLLLAAATLLSFIVIPASAAKEATLTLSDDLLSLDLSEETFIATLKVPATGEKSNWSAEDWSDWTQSIRWSLTRDSVDVQDPEFYPNIYTGDYLENWMSWGYKDHHGSDGEPYFTLEAPVVTVEDGTATVTLEFSHGIFFNMRDEKLPLVTNSLQAIGSNTFRYARNVWPSFIGSYEFAAEAGGAVIASTGMEINVYESNLRQDELYDELMEIKALAEEKDRYFDVRSFGKSTDGRDQWYVVVSDSEKSVKAFKEMNAKAMTDPEAVLAEIEDGKDYRMPIMLNNVHPDEAGGVDAHTNLLRTLATADTVPWNTITGLTSGEEVDMSMFDPKIVDFATTSDDGETEYAFTGYGLKISATTVNDNGNDGRTDASEYYTFSQTKYMDVDEILSNLIIIVSPDENPDGRTYNTRPNANGFDLNRDASNQTQVETRNIAKLISEWNPVAFIEFHGFTAQFLCEPCTPPHEPNLEYDLFVENFMLGAEAYGNSALATMSVQHKDEFETKYQTYYTPLRDSYDPETGWDAWDDLSTNYTPSYAMLNCGSMGFTIETPSGGESAVRLLESGMYGLWQFLSDCKDSCYTAQLEFFRRGIANEDHRAEMEEWYVDMSNNTLASDTWRIPYAGNDNYFPEYYVLPVDAGSQRDPADAYEMAEFLMRNGVKVSTLTKDVAVGGTTYKAGSLVIDMYQAKRNYANCVLNIGYNASASGFPDLYSESVASYPSMRGFDCVVITTKGAFDGALTELSQVIAATQVTGEGSIVILSNNGDETARAVNAMLAGGKAVGMVTEGEHKGDFVISGESFSAVADRFTLVATRTAEMPVARAIEEPTLFLVGRYADFGDDKVSSGYYAQWFADGYGFVNYDNIHNNGTSNYDVMAYQNQLGFKVTGDPSQADIIIGSVALNAGANGDAAVAAVRSGTPYIATGPNPLKYIQADLVPALAYESMGMEALHTVEYPSDSLTTASQTADGDNIIYTYNCDVLTAYPENAQVLIRAAAKDSFIVGCMIDGDISGGVEAISCEVDGMDLTIFANSIVNRSHQQDDYLFATNTIYSKMLSGSTMTQTDLDRVCFEDVTIDHWAADGIDYAVRKGLMIGTSDSVFAPANTTTYGMMATILARHAGVDTANGHTWFEKGMAWGDANGLTDGTEAEAPITRAQIAIMLFRYAKGEGDTALLADFADADALSGETAQAMAWAVKEGIVTGKPGKLLDPAGTASRAEMAVMLTRYFTK